MNRKMLSMKSSTSWFCSSRKYSAIVSAESATRIRVPGGSSICPNTSAVSLMTPDSVISVMRSLPSRVRSPTPANTEVPPKFLATRVIISWMSTVLPTPAPPNRPILPPTTYGVSRSMTLMPVSSISVLPSSWSNGGRLAVDAPQLAGDLQVGVVQALAERVEHVALDLVTDRHRDRTTEVGDLLAAHQSVGGLHGDGAHEVVAEVLGDLQRQGALDLRRSRRAPRAPCRAAAPGCGGTRRRRQGR